MKLKKLLETIDPHYFGFPSPVSILTTQGENYGAKKEDIALLRGIKDNTIVIDDLSYEDKMRLKNLVTAGLVSTDNGTYTLTDKGEEWLKGFSGDMPNMPPLVWR